MYALRAQGMVFLSPAEARGYLDSDESAYWVWLWGETPWWRQVRRPALWKRLLWRVWPPAVPRNRELAARQARPDNPIPPSDGM